MALLLLVTFFFTSSINLVEMLELPESVLLSSSEAGIGLLDKHDGRDRDHLIVLHLIELHQVDCIEVKTKDCVVIVKSLTKMSVDNEGFVVVTKVGDSGDLNLDHLESLLESTSAHISIMVCVFNVKDNELTESVSATESGETKLPVSVLIDLVSSHCENIHNLYEG